MQQTGKPPLFSNKYLFALIGPLLIETLLSVTIGMMDTIMVARVGEFAVSGVSLVDALSNLIIFLLSAFATGGAVVASQYLGKQDRKSSCFAAKQLIYISLIFSVAISLPLFIFREGTLGLIYGKTEESVMGAAVDYFTPILISYPFLALLNSANALFRAMGKSRITMVVSMIMNAINISGNAFFIYVLDMGTFGAGLASLISRVVACIFMLYKVTRTKETIHVEHIFRPELSASMIARIMKIALPSGIENCIFHIGKILVSSTIASFGTASIAANAVFNALGTFANIPGTAVGMASVAVIGQCCGARDYKAAEHYGWKLLALTYIMMGVTSAVMFILSPELAMLYNLSDEAYSLAVESIRLNMVQTLFAWPLAFTIPNFLRAAGDAKFTMYVSIASMWLFRVLLSRVLGVNLGMGFIGVCWGMFIDWYCRGIFYTVRFIKGKWKTKTVV